MKDPRFSFYLSNSMMRNWEDLCPRVWYEKWIKENPVYQFTSDAMERGNVFETLVIGMSVGKVATMPSEKLKSGVYYKRILKQAEDAKKYLRLLGGKILAVQEELKGVVTDSQGREVPIKGNLDIRYGWPNELGRNAVIDLKFSGDSESTYGDFGWGNISDMDCSQAIQYYVLHKLNWPELPYPEFYYHIYDSSPQMKKAHYRIKISDATVFNHIERMSKAYHEIKECMETGVWPAIKKFSVCDSCKTPCEHQVMAPEIIEIEK